MIHQGTLGLSPAMSRQFNARKERLARIAQAAVRQEAKADEAQVEAIQRIFEAPPVEVAPEPQPAPQPVPQPLPPAYIVPSKIATIQGVVAKEFNLPVEIMTAPSRRQGFVRPRQVAMYLCRKFLPDVSLPQIGRRFGRDHATVLRGTNKITRLLKFDLELAEAVGRLEAELAGLGGVAG